MSGIDQSAVASTFGLDTQYKDLREGTAAFLPQRLAVFAQGASASTYALTKWTATSAGAAGARYGYGSPIHLALRELMPDNGDGVGTIPIDVFPLADDGSGAFAAGTITPSGIATKAGQYKARISGNESNSFVIDAVDLSVPANLHIAIRRMGAAIAAPLQMPVTVGYTYGTVTASAITGTGNGTVTALAVHTGSTPKPGAWTLKCTTATTNGGTFQLTDPDGVALSTLLVMTVGVGAATVFSNAAGSGLDLTLTDGTTDFGLNASFTITVPATNVVVTSKWKGTSANALRLEVIGDSLGVAFALVQPTGGLVNPSVSTALTKQGSTWYTMALNAFDTTDATALDAFQVAGEGLWDPLVRRPWVVFVGDTNATVAAATAVPDARKTDRVNAQLVAPGSVELPLAVAARQLARIARVANNNPPVSYQKQRATGLIPGDDAVQWNYTVKDQAVKAGSSTVDSEDSVLKIADVVTFYHPTGESPPGYRYVVTIVKLQNCIYNFNQEFTKVEWAAAPFVADADVVENTAAKKPLMVKAKANDLLVGLGKQALIANVAAAKKKTTAQLNANNPNRIDLTVEFPVSSNGNIISMVQTFGFLSTAA
jgi:phage tail sheath gpL-like